LDIQPRNAWLLLSFWPGANIRIKPKASGATKTESPGGFTPAASVISNA
jgi:hypothetical protein